MEDLELVKMSPKGQLVVPQKIREQQHFESADRFIAVSVKEGVLFKKVKIPDVKAEFRALSKEIEQKFKEKDIPKEDVNEAVRWARKR